MYAAKKSLIKNFQALFQALNFKASRAGLRDRMISKKTSTGPALSKGCKEKETFLNVFNRSAIKKKSSNIRRCFNHG